MTQKPEGLVSPLEGKGEGSSCTETAARGTTASRPDSSCKSEAILANVRPEIRDEVAYAIQLAAASCPICEGTGRATWLDDCEDCKPEGGR
jgi:DnaJ-class molecular chaperone